MSDQSLQKLEEFLQSLDTKGKLGWRAAVEIIEPYSSVPANFTEIIRLLVAHYENSAPTLSPTAQALLLRLLSNKTIKANYYYLTKHYKPEGFGGKTHLTSKDLLHAYSPIDHACILSFAYLFRNLSKKTEREEWEYVETPLTEALAIGAAIGANIPEIGVGLGMMCRGLRYLAFAPFLRDNRRGFKEYRRHLKTADLPFDTTFEHKTWQCSNVQVAAIILQRMGFNRTMGLQFVAAAEHDAKVPVDSLYGIRFRIAEAVIHEYSENGEIIDRCPDWVGKKLPFPAETRGRVLTKLNQILPNLGKYEWLSKGSASINPDSTPEFFAEAPPSREEEKAEPTSDSALEG